VGEASVLSGPLPQDKGEHVLILLCSSHAVHVPGLATCGLRRHEESTHPTPEEDSLGSWGASQRSLLRKQALPLHGYPTPTHAGGVWHVQVVSYRTYVNVWHVQVVSYRNYVNVVYGTCRSSPTATMSMWCPRTPWSSGLNTGERVHPGMVCVVRHMQVKGVHPGTVCAVRHMFCTLVRAK